MTLEQWILIIIWVVCILAMLCFVPRNRLRIFVMATLIGQTFMWLDATVIVSYDLITFPVREFPKATELLFTTEYLLYPVLFGFFILYMPDKGWFVRVLYSVVWISAVSFLDYVLQKYTDLIEYIHYWPWLSFSIRYIVGILIFHWFFKDLSLLHEDKMVAK